MPRLPIFPWGPAAAASLLVALLAPPAAAQARRDNHYGVDVFQGPVLAPSDVIGIAGAYAGYAEGIAGMVANAAAPGVREPTCFSYFNWDLSASISIPFNLFGPRDDFDNSGAAGRDYTDFIYGTVGGLIQYGPFGVGFNAEVQRYALKPASGPATAVTLGKYHALAGYRLLGDQLIFGAGARIATLSMVPGDAETSLTMIGAGPEIGVLVRPDWQSFRLGATVRLPVHGGRLIGAVRERADGVHTSGGLVLPDDVVLPWEVELGGAVQVGPRPINPAFIDPHAQEAALHASFAQRRRARELAQARELATIGDPADRALRKLSLEADEVALRILEDADEKRITGALEADRRARYGNWPREHLLLTLELLITGAVTDGVSLQRFLGQNQAPAEPWVVGSSGGSVSFSPRFGVETEPLPGRMHTRAGSYYEPSRQQGRVGRQHFTFGLDVRLFTTTWFGLTPPVTYKAQACADLSPRYQSASLGVGVWH
jgi:hypothetical protein